MQQTMTVSNLSIDVIKKDIKNLHLWVYPPSGRIRVAAPHNMDDEYIRLFLVSKLSWIKKHQKTFNGQERETIREYISGESHYMFGQRYLLRVIELQNTPKVAIKNKKYIELIVRPWSTTEQKANILKERYRSQLAEKVPNFINKRSTIMWVDPQEWRIKQMKTKRWTCNIKDKRIRLNLELAKKSEQCLEYVVVHELTHLLEKYHNDKFTAYMDQFLPKRRHHKKKLNAGILKHETW